MKLCRDCKHYDGKQFCLRSIKPDLVNGEVLHYSAENERHWETATGCGPEGKFYVTLTLREEYPDKYAQLKRDEMEA